MKVYYPTDKENTQMDNFHSKNPHNLTIANSQPVKFSCNKN